MTPWRAGRPVPGMAAWCVSDSGTLEQWWDGQQWGPDVRCLGGTSQLPPDRVPLAVTEALGLPLTRVADLVS